jgi:hypothetical protein
MINEEKESTFLEYRPALLVGLARENR